MAAKIAAGDDVPDGNHRVEMVELGDGGRYRPSVSRGAGAELILVVP